MAARVVMGGGMPVRRVIAAADVTALQADPQVKPDSARAEAVFATMDALWELEDLHAVEVGAVSHFGTASRLG
jgi:hypothetical protein